MKAIADKYRKLRAAGKLHGTIGDAVAKRIARDNAAVTEPTYPRLVTIPLDSLTAGEVRDITRMRYPRLQNWTMPHESTDISLHDIRVDSTNHGRYSSRCTFNRYSYTPVVRSCGVITTRRLLYFYRDRSGMVKAPRGWHFGCDILGLYIERNDSRDAARRYHFSMDDLEYGDLMSQARAHHDRQTVELRKERHRKRLLKQATALTIMVTPRDSVASGNCAAGTMRFAQMFSLRSCVPSDTLMQLAETNPQFRGQIHRAVATAMERYIEDLQRGFCLIK